MPARWQAPLSIDDGLIIYRGGNVEFRSSGPTNQQPSPS